MHPFFFTILVVSLYSVAPLVVKLPSSKRTNKSNCRLDGETIQHSKSKISDSNPFLSPNDVEYKSQHDTLYNFLDGPLIFVKDPKRTLSQLSSRRGSLSLLSASLATILTPSPTLASGPPPKRIPVSTSSPPVPSQPSLKFLTSPLNIRTGSSLSDVETVYPLKFVTYLTRFLISFDPACQKWWYLQASEIPRTASKEEVGMIRTRQFASFAASVEVGLREYRDSIGPQRLMGYMLARYCPGKMEDVVLEQVDGKANVRVRDGATKDVKEREVREARRQIVLLFSLLPLYQPTSLITQTLASIENATLSTVTIMKPGQGYAPGYGPPEVTFSDPEAPDGVRAEGRAKLGESGRVLRVDIDERGLGYKKAPNVEVLPPASGNGTTAKAQAIVFEGKNDNKGRIERIKLIDPGSGYEPGEEIKVRISPPDSPVTQGGFQATAVAVKEYEVVRIEVTNPGSGYASEKPISARVSPPPITARTNINDPMLLKTRGMDAKVLAGVVAEAAKGNDSTGGAAGCVGRGCYDEPVVAEGYTKSEFSAGKSFREEGDSIGVFEKATEEVDKRGLKAVGVDAPYGFSSNTNQTTIRATGSGADSAPRLPTLGGGLSSTAKLLTLFPEGVGVVFDTKKKQYVLTLSQDALDTGLVIGGGQGSSPKPLDPDFGPRGRSPVERERELTPSTYLRFMAAGALCCSTVHLAVTPLDVVKTKLQTNPKDYPNPVAAFQKVLSNGLSTFFTGWDTTFAGFFVWGSIGYTLTEFLRRYITVAIDAPKDGSWEIPIVILSASLGAFAGCFFLCPFETIRIRMVSGGGEGGLVSVAKNIISEKGPGALFDAVPAFLLKEIPFAAAKFAVFDYTTTILYEQFPAAREDLRLSLAVSLCGGCLGGIVAAAVSNPADSVISEMKKIKSPGKVEVTAQAAVVAVGEGGEDGVERDTAVATMSSPQPPKTTIKMAYQTLNETYGVAGFFRGLSIRIPFYCLVVSLQFLLYDSIRVFLGVGRDDLNLFLDVLGGALGERMGDIM